MIEKKLLFRTMLFAPGHNEKIIHKAALSDADALVLDLEDSCKPDSNKAKAREVIKRIVGSGELKKYFVFVRINPRETGFMFKDISELTIKGINGFLYPMANSEKDIIFFSNLLTEIEMSKGIKKGYFKIFPVIETAEGILNARKICAASKRVVALGFGSEDFTTDLQSIRDEEGVSIFIPRANIALAARSQGVIPIDTPHVDVHNLESLEKHCMDARTLGFGGMQILHPKEIEIVHKVYSPSKKEVEYAKEIIKLSKEAEKENRGVAILDGKFVAPPMVKRAKKTIELSELINSALKNREV